MTSDAQHPPVRVWDLPTRAFHWLLALAVIGLVVTAKVGGNAMLWHMRLGLVGGRWSRFASFIYAPGKVLRYLRGDHRPGDHFEVGHSPLGAFSVFALITLLLVQVGTGLISDDEIATTGPLNRYVASATGIAATGWHKGYGQWILLGLVALHIVAIVVYKLRGGNLVTPMITGDKPLPPDVPAAQDNLASRGLAAVVLAACAALAVWIARQGA